MFPLASVSVTAFRDHPPHDGITVVAQAPRENQHPERLGRRAQVAIVCGASKMGTAFVLDCGMGIGRKSDRFNPKCRPTEYPGRDAG